MSLTDEACVRCGHKWGSSTTIKPQYVNYFCTKIANYFFIVPITKLCSKRQCNQIATVKCSNVPGKFYCKPHLEELHDLVDHDVKSCVSEIIIPIAAPANVSLPAAQDNQQQQQQRKNDDDDDDNTFIVCSAKLHAQQAHPTQAEFVCITCNYSAVCYKCHISDNHKNHEVITIEKWHEHINQRLQLNCKQAQEHLTALEQAEDNLTLVLQYHENQFTRGMTKVSAFFAMLKNIVSTAEKEQKTQLNDQFAKKKQSIDNELLKTKSFISAISNSKKLMKEYFQLNQQQQANNNAVDSKNIGQNHHLLFKTIDNRLKTVCNEAGKFVTKQGASPNICYEVEVRHLSEKTLSNFMKHSALLVAVSAAPLSNVVVPQQCKLIGANYIEDTLKPLTCSKHEGKVLKYIVKQCTAEEHQNQQEEYFEAVCEDCAIESQHTGKQHFAVEKIAKELKTTSNTSTSTSPQAVEMFV